MSMGSYEQTVINYYYSMTFNTLKYTFINKDTGYQYKYDNRCAKTLSNYIIVRENSGKVKNYFTEFYI